MINKRNEILTQVELTALQSQPQFLMLNQKQFILYNWVVKESDSGWFNNHRFLILNIRTEQLYYLSKIPNGIIPFINQQEVKSLQFKSIIYMKDIYQNGENKAICLFDNDKKSVQIKINKDNCKIQWKYFFNNLELMKIWYQHLSFLVYRNRQEIDQRYHKVNKQQDNNNTIGQTIKHNQSLSNDKLSPQEGKQSLLNHQLSPQESKPTFPNDQLSLQKGKPSQPQLQSSHIMANIQLQPQSKNQLPNANINKFEAKPLEEKFPQLLQNKQIIKTDIKQQQQNIQISQIQKLIKQQNDQSNRSNKSLRQDFNVIIHDTKQRLRQRGRHYKLADDLQNNNNNMQSSLPISMIQNSTVNNNNKINKIKQDNNKIIKQNQSKYIDWNQLYYKDKINSIYVYYDFINICKDYIMSLVDNIPLDNSIMLSSQNGQPFIKQHNGIRIIIAFQNQNQNSGDQPKERKQRQTAGERLKRQFYEERNVFFKEQSLKPQLICYIEYKGVISYCKAFSRVQAQSPIKLDKIEVLSQANDHQRSILKKMASLQLHITSSSDLQDIMRYLQTYKLDWVYLYNNCNIKIFKNQFLNEIYSEIYVKLIRFELKNIYEHFPLQPNQKTNKLYTQQVILDSILMFINLIFSKNKESEELWSNIFKQIQSIDKIKSNQQNILSGYLLYSIIIKMGLQPNQNIKLKNHKISGKVQLLQKQNIKGFIPIIKYLQLQKMSSLLLSIKHHLLSQDNYHEKLLELTSVKQYLSIPPLINHFKAKIHLQSSKVIPYDKQKINVIYKDIMTDIPSYINYQLSLSAMNWLLQQKNRSEALNLAAIKIQQILYWIGRIPMISLFHEALANYYFLNEEYQNGIEELKRSIQNLIKIFGEDCMVVVQVKLKLCNSLLLINRKEECIKQLKDCKIICQSKSFVNQPMYLDILKKISKISLSLSKYNDSINSSIACLKHLQSKATQDQAQYKNQQSAGQFLQIAELLLRAFELANRREQLFQIAALCVERFVLIDNIKLTKKLFKVLLFPYLKRLSKNEAQIFLLFIKQLKDLYLTINQRQQTLYQYIKQRKMMINFSEKLANYFKKLIKIHQKIIKLKEMDEFYNNYEQYIQDKSKSQTKLFLVQMYLTVNLIKSQFIEAIVKDSFYQ